MRVVVGRTWAQLAAHMQFLSSLQNWPGKLRNNDANNWESEVKLRKLMHAHFLHFKMHAGHKLCCWPFFDIFCLIEHKKLSLPKMLHLYQAFLLTSSSKGYSRCADRIIFLFFYCCYLLPSVIDTFFLFLSLLFSSSYRCCCCSPLE